jgi:hypothetical protein
MITQTARRQLGNVHTPSEGKDPGSSREPMAHSSGDCAEATECLRKVDIGISVNPKRETVLSYFANEEALGFELVCGADFEYYGPSKTS